MTPKEILDKINIAKPKLPNNEVLALIAFKWNNDELDTWDGGFDLNEKTRSNIIELLIPNFIIKDNDYLEILRFLLKQEIENSNESESFLVTLQTCYDSLADYKHLEDIPLLLAANNDTSFDANCALSKDRLFYNGYNNVMNYLKSNKDIDENIIEQIEYYADSFKYKNNN